MSAAAGNLFCYECSEAYNKVYDPKNSPCRHNLSQIIVRRCSASEKYCKVERVESYKIVLSIARGCVSKCPWGCRFTGYALTQMKCTTCCTTYGCNTGNGCGRQMASLIFYNLMFLLSFSTVAL